MNIIPSLSIKDEYPVIVDGESYCALRDADGKRLDAVDLIEELARDHERLLIVDIDGISTGEPQLELMMDLPAHVSFWVDAGVQTAEDIYDLFMIGANGVVVGTKRLVSLGQLEEMCEVSDKVILGLDFSDGELVSCAEGLDLDTFLEKARELEIKEVIVEVLNGGIHPDVLKRISGSGLDTYVTTKRDRSSELEGLVSGIIVDIREVKGGLKWRS